MPVLTCKACGATVDRPDLDGADDILAYVAEHGYTCRACQAPIIEAKRQLVEWRHTRNQYRMSIVRSYRKKGEHE